MWVEEHPWEPSIWQARNPNATWCLSRLRRGGGWWGPGGGLPSTGSRGTGATGPPSRRVWPRWLFCATAAHGGGGRVSSPPQPTLASVPRPARPVSTSICQQVLSSVHLLPSCPLRVWIPRSSRETVLAPSGFVNFTGTCDTQWDVCRGERQVPGDTRLFIKSFGALLSCLRLF